MSFAGGLPPQAIFFHLEDQGSGFSWIAGLDEERPRLLYACPSTGPLWQLVQERLQQDVRGLSGLIHPEDLPVLQSFWDRLLTGEAVSGEFRLVTPDSAVHPVRGRAFPLYGDHSDPQAARPSCPVTEPCLERRLAEDALAWEAGVNAALAEISQAILSSASVEELCRLVLAKAQELTGSEMGSVAYRQAGKLVFIPLTGEADDDGLCSCWPHNRLDWAARWARSLAEKQVLLVNDPPPWVSRDGKAVGHFRFMGVPVTFRDRLLGQIALATCRRDYTDRDLNALMRLASLFAIALGRQEAEEALKESEERFRSLVEAITDLVWETDAAGCLTYVSPSIQDLLGYTPAEVLGKTFADLLEPKGAEQMGELLGPIIESRKPYVYVGKTILHKGGKRVILESSGVPILDSKGRFLGYRGLDRDITERHRASEALVREKEKYRTLVEESPLGVAIIGEDGTYKYINPKFVQMFGYTLADIPTGQEWFRLAYPDPEYRQQVISAWLEDLKNSHIGEARCRTFTVTCKDGSQKTINFRSVTLITGDQQVIYEDVTQRQQAEAALRESESKYRLLVSNIPAVVFRGYADWYVEFFDDKVEELTGYSREDFKWGRLKWLDLILPEDLEECQNIFREALKTTGAYVRQYRIRHKQGHIIWIEARGQIVRDPDSRIDHVYGVFFDITKQKESEEAQKKVEQALAAEKERLRVTLRSIGEGVIATDREGRVVLMNQVAETLTGWTQEEALGRPVSKVLCLVHESTRKSCDNRVEKVIQKRKVLSLPAHAMLLARDGAERVLSGTAAPIIDQVGQVIGVVLVFQDITLRRQTEAELQKMEKLSSVGILHDFNNILTGILGNISLAMLSIPPEGQAFRRLTEAEQATLRARDLVQQLLTFAKGGAPVKEISSLEEIIRDSATFACRGSQVRCVFSFPKDLWPAEVDPGQISQVIQNLVINAIQAMPTGGAITISTENVTLKEDQGVPLPAGRYLKIKIEDQGIGIPADYLPKIFDPYFSTKQKGSGLGLTTAYSIIKNHDGYIAVNSTLGVGTTFTIYLPSTAKRAKPLSQTAVSYLHKGQGRILVMDDDPGVRRVAGKILDHLGYEVEFAEDGTEAIAKYQEACAAGRPFDLVIMDLTIPGGMGGKEALQALRQIDPSTRAVVSSGYADDPIMTHYEDYGFCGVIKKPYKVSTFSHIVHQVLQQSKS